MPTPAKANPSGETGDGHGTTLVVTDAGLLAVGIEPVVVKTMAAVREHAAAATMPKIPTLRTGTKQAQIIALLQRPDGASVAEIVAVTGWLAHSVRGLISGSLKKKLGLPVTSEKQDGRGTVYSLPNDGSAPSSQPHEEPTQDITSQQ